MINQTIISEPYFKVYDYDYYGTLLAVLLTKKDYEAKEKELKLNFSTMSPKEIEDAIVKDAIRKRNEDSEKRVEAYRKEKEEKRKRIEAEYGELNPVEYDYIFNNYKLD